jgi:hypothetical protein
LTPSQGCAGDWNGDIAGRLNNFNGAHALPPPWEMMMILLLFLQKQNLETQVDSGGLSPNY